MPLRRPGARPGRAFFGWMPYRSQFAHVGERGWNSSAPGGVGALGVGVGVAAVADLLGEVFG